MATRIPKYRARYRDQSGWHDISWDGRATAARAERQRQALNRSFQIGGVNEHVSHAAGYAVHVSRLEIRTNSRQALLVASANAPMFEVV